MTLNMLMIESTMKNGLHCVRQKIGLRPSESRVSKSPYIRRYSVSVPADMLEVFKRLGESAHKFLDEQCKELPLPEKHWGDEPLFLQGRQ